MAFSPLHDSVCLIAITLVILASNHASADTCSDSDCFVQSRATFYSTSDNNGAQRGACGFGSFGATMNGGDVSAASDLYQDGVGCGACYQVRCTNNNNCSDEGVTIVITDSGSSDRTAFILNKHAFVKMAQTADAAQSLTALGVIDIEYKRVPCSYPNKNITFKIDESSNNPFYLAFAIYYQQGTKDITAVQLCETQGFNCKLLVRDHGAVWATASPPKGPLSIRMLMSDDDSEDADDKWIVPVNDIPGDWKAGDLYDSGVQVN